MATDSLPSVLKKAGSRNGFSDAGDDHGNTTGDVVDPDTLEVLRKPLASAKEAHSAAGRDFSDRSTANTLLGLVQSQYNGEPPYKGQLGKRGQGWRTDVSVKSLSTMVERKTPVLVGFVDGLRYLTAARLPDDPEDVNGKSDKFQAAFTRLVRSWAGWRNFLYPLVGENILHGGAAAAPLDEVEWRPTFFRQTEFAVPAGSGQNVSDLKRVSFYKAFPIDDLRGMVEDVTAATDAGWNTENVAEAINKATPSVRKEPNVASGSTSRSSADQQRDSNTQHSGATDDGKVIETYVVVYKEYTGKVSQYVVTVSGGKELFFKEDLYESMEDAVSLFAVQFGNGHFYGSVGLGRILHGLHLARNRNLCRMLDDVWYSSLEDARTDEQTKTKVAVSINYPFRVTTGTGEQPVNRRQSFTEAFLLVESKLENLIEQLANAYLPNKIEGGGEKPTARQVIEDVKKANLSDGDLLARFYGQFCALMGMMQRRAYSVENLKAAKDVIKKLEDGKTLVSKHELSDIKSLTKGDKALDGDIQNIASDGIPGHLDREAVWSAVRMMQDGLNAVDIYRLARQPASEPLGDNSATMNMKVAAIAQKYMGSPFVDSAKIVQDDLAATGNAQLAERYFVPTLLDQTVTLEAMRQQLEEIATMVMIGRPVPVSARDNHKAHLKVLFDEFQNVIQGLPAVPSEEYLKVLENNLQHAEMHVAARESAHEQGPELTADKQRLHTIAGQISRLADIWNAEHPPQGAAQPTPQQLAASQAQARMGQSALNSSAARNAATAFANSAGLAKRDAEIRSLLDPSGAAPPPSAPADLNPTGAPAGADTAAP